MNEEYAKTSLNKPINLYKKAINNILYSLKLEITSLTNKTKEYRAYSV